MGERPGILVVDDDPHILHFLGEAVRSLGLEPYCVDSGDFALHLIEDRRFDGILLDWQMPEMSGTELARRIRRSVKNAESPIVLLTGFPSPEVVQESLEAGVNYFLAKPVSLPQLRNLLDPQHGSATEERRHQDRQPMRMPVVCQWSDRAADGQVVNISAEGARLALEEVPPMHSWVSLAVHAPGQTKPVELTGQVVRVTFRAGRSQGPLSREVGVRFVGASNATADWLDAHRAKLVPSGAV